MLRNDLFIQAKAYKWLCVTSNCKIDDLNNDELLYRGKVHIKSLIYNDLQLIRVICYASHKCIEVKDNCYLFFMFYFLSGLNQKKEKKKKTSHVSLISFISEFNHSILLSSAVLILTRVTLVYTTTEIAIPYSIGFFWVFVSVAVICKIVGLECER